MIEVLSLVTVLTQNRYVISHQSVRAMYKVLFLLGDQPLRLLCVDLFERT